MHGGVGEDQSTTGLRRLPVAEASEVLGITVEAVRRRIKRGTLEHERDSGPVFVLLGADHSDDQPRPDDDQTSDRLRSDSAALISEMRDRIESLERQLEQERQANSEHRRLLAAALDPAAARSPAGGLRGSRVGRGGAGQGRAPLFRGRGSGGARHRTCPLRDGGDHDAQGDDRGATATRKGRTGARPAARRVDWPREANRSPRGGRGAAAGKGPAPPRYGRGPGGARRPWWRRVFGR
jgi:hypothetical protein